MTYHNSKFTVAVGTAVDPYAEKSTEKKIAVTNKTISNNEKSKSPKKTDGAKILSIKREQSNIS